MRKVSVVGYTPQFLFISFVKLLRSVTGEGLAAAKAETDAMLEGQPITIQFETDEAADLFVAEAQRVGARTEIPNQALIR